MIDVEFVLNFEVLDKKVKRSVLLGIKKVLDNKIVDEIKSGVSPVKGESFDKYSESYLKAIQKKRYRKYNKSVSPINLHLTGKMLKSYKSKLIKDGIETKFTDKKAVYHNKDGAGKSKVLRRMLPTEKGEEWNEEIEDKMQVFLDNLPKI